MLHFIHDSTRPTDEYILNYMSDVLKLFTKWKQYSERDSGKQVK